MVAQIADLYSESVNLFMFHIRVKHLMKMQFQQRSEMPGVTARPVRPEIDDVDCPASAAKGVHDHRS